MDWKEAQKIIYTKITSCLSEENAQKTLDALDVWFTMERYAVEQKGKPAEWDKHVTKLLTEIAVIEQETLAQIEALKN